MATISTTSLRPGNVFEHEGHKYLVLKHSHIKKGRGQAVNRIKVKDLESGSTVEKTFTNEQSVAEADVMKKNAQFLYLDESSAYFMASDDYQQFSLELESLGDHRYFLIDGLKVITLYIDGEPVSIELPSTVELSVEYTEPGVSGNTVSGAMKDAIMHTGIKIRVPLFIKIGDVIKVNTESLNYIARI